MPQRGRSAEAETALEKLLGGSHVKFAMVELSKSDRGDEADKVKLSELLYGRHFRGTLVLFRGWIYKLVSFQIIILTSLFAVVFIGSALFVLQQLSGINAVFYFSSTVFKNAGVPSKSANICIGIFNLSGIGSFIPRHFIFYFDLTVFF